MPSTLKRKTFYKVQAYLLDKIGLYFSFDRKLFLEESFTKRMKVHHLESYEDYLHYLESAKDRQQELKMLIDSITICETSFFRNTHHFDVLENFVLPELAEQKNENNKTLRIWCAGCSTGDEPYSIAILLKEKLHNFKDWNITILATDINSTVLDFAKKGVFREKSVKNMPNEYRQKYFTHSNKTYTLNGDIKKMVTFKNHNVLIDPFYHEEANEFDIIFCRNVTIYFNIEDTKKIMSKFYEVLHHNGFLFIGHSESLWQISEKFMPLDFQQCYIYKKKSDVEASDHISLIMNPSCDDEVHVPKIDKIETDYCSISSNNSSKAQVDIDDLMSESLAQASKERYSDALNSVLKVIEHDELHLEANFVAGVLFNKLNQNNRAIEAFENALYIDHTCQLAYFHLANIYRDSGDIEKARKNYQNCLKSIRNLEDDQELQLGDGVTVSVLHYAVNRALEMLSP